MRQKYDWGYIDHHTAGTTIRPRSVTGGDAQVSTVVQCSLASASNIKKRARD